jgi:hypothetical protein
MVFFADGKAEAFQWKFNNSNGKYPSQADGSKNQSRKIEYDSLIVMVRGPEGQNLIQEEIDDVSV